jgi:DNA-binding Xre family transcriptional regulator
MYEILRQRLTELMASRRTTPAALSRAIGKGPTFIHDFLRGQSKSFKAGVLVEIERELRCKPGELSQIGGNVSSAVLDSPSPEHAEISAFTSRRLPVYGRPNIGTRPGLIMDSKPVDFTPAPSSLEGVEGAYAVYVPDGLMAPRYLAGEMAYVHPARPITIGCFALIRFRGEPPTACIRRIVRIAAGEIEVEQFAPAKTERFERREIDLLHRVIGSGER